MKCCICGSKLGKDGKEAIKMLSFDGFSYATTFVCKDGIFGKGTCIGEFSRINYENMSVIFPEFTPDS